MSRRLIGDVYEWFNVIPTVPIYVVANQQQRERAL